MVSIRRVLGSLPRRGGVGERLIDLLFSFQMENIQPRSENSLKCDHCQLERGTEPHGQDVPSLEFCEISYAVLTEALCPEVLPISLFVSFGRMGLESLFTVQMFSKSSKAMFRMDPSFVVPFRERVIAGTHAWWPEQR